MVTEFVSYEDGVQSAFHHLVNEVARMETSTGVLACWSVGAEGKEIWNEPGAERFCISRFCKFLWSWLTPNKVIKHCHVPLQGSTR